MLKSFQIFSQSASVYSVTVLTTALIQTKDHSNVSPADWTSVPTLMHRLRARLAETLMSTGDQSYTRIFTVDQTHFAAVVGCPCCGNFRRYCSILWRCLIGHLCLILVCAIGVSSKMVIQRCMRCGRPCCDSWRPRTASVYRRRAAVIAIDAGFDACVVHKTPLCFRATDT